MSDVTLNGLESWHRSLVEKFGWTVIAVEKGHTQKGENFLLCLENLINSIQLRLNDGIQSIDSHKDLEILLNNSNLLKNKAKLMLNLHYDSKIYPLKIENKPDPILNVGVNYEKIDDKKYGGKITKKSLKRK
jgi:hypothetical protein